MKVSVIVPVYNLFNYISKCISSIVSQTYKDLEIIIINDGSTDNSISEINRLASTDNRIIVIDKKNEGVSVARNTGIERATGKYIMFVDGDDWIDTDMVQKLIDKAEKNQADYVGGGFIFEDPDIKKRRFSPDGFSPVTFKNRDVFKNYLAGKYIWSSVWGGIYLRETEQWEKAALSQNAGCLL